MRCTLEIDMEQNNTSSLALARTLLRLLTILNIASGAGIFALLVASFVAEPWTIRALGVGAAGPALLIGMRLVMVVGIVSVPLIHVVLTRLAAIVGTVGSNDPFVLANAARLRSIAWTLLGLELLRLGVGAIASAASFRAAGIDIGWNLALTPWLSILLLFVLASVFGRGAAMRADLEGTV